MGGTVDVERATMDGESAQEQSRRDQVQRRSAVTTAFVGFLVGLAIQEAIHPVRESSRIVGGFLATYALFIVFMLTTIRFFIGYQLLLMDEKLLSMSKPFWFFDFIVIIFETIILTFMAGVCTIQERAHDRYGFIEMLGALLVVDVLWVTIQWIFARIKGWDRKVLWGWGISGVCLLITMGIGQRVTGNLYSNAGLWWLLLLNVVAFGFDLFYIDHYGFFKSQEEGPEPPAPSRQM